MQSSRVPTTKSRERPADPGLAQRPPALLAVALEHGSPRPDGEVVRHHHGRRPGRGSGPALLPRRGDDEGPVPVHQVDVVKAGLAEPPELEGDRVVPVEPVPAFLDLLVLVVRQRAGREVSSSPRGLAGWSPGVSPSAWSALTKIPPGTSAAQIRSNSRGFSPDSRWWIESAETTMSYGPPRSALR